MLIKSETIRHILFRFWVAKNSKLNKFDLIYNIIRANLNHPYPIYVTHIDFRKSLIYLFRLNSNGSPGFL